MKTAIIVAFAKNGVIGNKGKIPWMGKISADMRNFVKLTTGNAVIMGLKTFYSLPDNFRPLPNRQNIVLSEVDLDEKGIDVAHSLQEAFDLVRGDLVFIGGGAFVYKQIMDQDLADKIYATEIHEEFEGDAFFPAIDPKKWREVSRESIPKDEKNQLDADFVEYERR
ncbi:dihydrofolate reductase [Candidatus Saccharibacteria bacterium]|nr:dihydrofolate reductase [Candidatus Saccharibacteria bacterium]MCL1962824.1 dihydrofolate reductase [Candidatus Saccharibacteria bacterium]